MQMTYSQNGLHLTEQFESCRLVAYLDGKGVPTIAWGHTAGVQLGDTCTQAQADGWLQRDIGWAEATVNRYVTTEVTQGEFDALVDFVFNCGTGNFQHSTLLALVDQGRFAEAADEFCKWDRAGGTIVAGLLRRRLAEKQEFNT